MRDRLYRSRDERVLFGVAGGVAEWLDVDPAVVRIVFALLVLTAGFGLLLYLIMAIVIPEEPELLTAPPAPADPNAPPAPPSGQAWVDARAARRSVRRYVPALDGDFLGPIVLLLIGAALVAGSATRGGKGAPPAQG
jgi:phage shock protein C